MTRRPLLLAAAWLALLVLSLDPLLQHLGLTHGPMTASGMLAGIGMAALAFGSTVFAGILWAGTGFILLVTREILAPRDRPTLAFMAGVWAATLLTLPGASAFEWEGALAPWLLLVLVQMEGLRTCVTAMLRVRAAPAEG